MALGDRAPGPAMGALISTLALVALMGGFIVLAFDGRQVAQVSALLAPLPLWQLWPVSHRAVHRLRVVLVSGATMLVVADSLVRAYVAEAYQAAPDSAFVVMAAANSNLREIGEYTEMNATLLAALGLLWCGLAVLIGWLATQGRRGPGCRPTWIVSVMVVLLLLSAVGHAIRPWRQLHPAVFWSGWVEQARLVRAGWEDRLLKREQALRRAQDLDPIVAIQGRSTVVLVLTESVNRDNLALYGYARPTTPGLLAHRDRQGDHLQVLRNAWSVDASTLPALRNLFGFGGAQGAPHLLALARAAGYKVWWMSNHDDIGVEQEHGRFADVVDVVNRTPGRVGNALDGELLDNVEAALAAPEARKLIVVHLLGAHPHYRLRYPTDQNPFDDRVDATEAKMIDAGRSALVRRYRNEYDAAVLYQDSVVSDILRQIEVCGPTNEHRALIYLSDHGQEVGHVGNHAGHSPATPAGYRIPTLVWRSRPFAPVASGAQAIASRPFRADWGAWTVAGLLGLQWAGENPSRDVLSDAYRWEAPDLPISVASFSDLPAEDPAH